MTLIIYSVFLLPYFNLIMIKKSCLTRYVTTRLDNLRDAVFGIRPLATLILILWSIRSATGLTTRTVSIVSKYFPTTCASCPLGNFQSIDAYGHFKATTIGQTELDLKIWTTVDGKRAYSFKKHYISATYINLLTGMLFGSTFTSRKKLLC